MYENIDFDNIDLTQNPPQEEPDRQYYYIAKARQYVQEKSRGTDDAAAARRRIQEDARYGAPMASHPTDACQAPEPMEAPKSAPMPAPKSAPPRPAPRFSAPMSAAPMERPSAAAPKQSVHTGEKPSLAQLLEKTDAGFSETLLKLIDSILPPFNLMELMASQNIQH